MDRDWIAAQRLRSLRMDSGLSPERLGALIGVSGHTVRRIERYGSIPTPRVQFQLASHFGLRPTDLWQLVPKFARAA